MKSRSSKKTISDLNYILIRDRHEKAIFKKLIYSYVLMAFLLIAIQLFLFALFLFKLYPYLQLFLGGSIVISTAFMVYLSNCKGKNEFKLAWLVPTVIFPFFGIAAYIMFHINFGSRKMGKRLAYLKEKTESISSGKTNINDIAEKFPDIAGLARYLNNHGNYYPHTNTKISYHPCGEDFFPDLFNSIKSAKKFVFLEYFIIDIDESWLLILELLEQKVKEGVEVRILFDGLGSPLASSKTYIKYLNELGIKAHPFQPLVPFFTTQQNNRDHRKIAIIDGKVAFTGGLNLSNEYFNVGENRFAYWKDNAVRIEGPAIQNFITMFLQTWNLQTKIDDDYEGYINCAYEKFDTKGAVIPYGDDAFNNEDIAEEIYNYILDNSKKYVHITTPYMVIDNQLIDSLLFAAHRGIEVSVIVPAAPDHFLTFCIGKTFLKTLIDNGIHVYLYKKGFIHAKTFISDNKISTIGSVNMDYRSLYHHFECGAVIYDEETATTIEKDFQETLKDCVEMKSEDYKKIPSRIRLLGRVFRIFAPLL